MSSPHLQTAQARWHLSPCAKTTKNITLSTAALPVPTMSHFGGIEPAAAATDPKDRWRLCQGNCSAPGGSWPLTEATIAARSATPNNHAAARPEAGSWTPWPRTVVAGNTRAGSGSGGQMSQPQPVEDNNNNNKRHTRIWDCCHVDAAAAAAPRRNYLHLSAPLSSRNRTPPPSRQGEEREEDDYGVWDELDMFLAELKLAQQLGGGKATQTKRAIPTGGMGNFPAKMVSGREGVKSACEEMAFF